MEGASISLYNSLLCPDRFSANREISSEEWNTSIVCIAWVTLTNGRREFLSATRTSWYEKMTGQISKEIIVDDSGSFEYRSWLEKTFPTAEVIPAGTEALGFARAMQRCFDEALHSGCDYVFHLEDDFKLNEYLDLDKLHHILKENPSLSQLVLQRNRWYLPEFEFDTLLQAVMSSGVKLTERQSGNHTYLEQTDWWSCNPNIYPIDIARLGWVIEEDSERKFSKKVFSQGYKSAFYGSPDKDSFVEHIGRYRAGYDY